MAGLDLNSTEGCTFVGILFSLILYGGTLAQTLFYFYHYPKDHTPFKLLVGGLWILDSAKEAITVQILYFTSVQGHGNILSLLHLPITYGAEHALAAGTVLVVQCFYIHNIWRLLTKTRFQWLLTLTGLLFSTISFSASLGVVYEVYGNPDLVAAEARVLTAGRVQASFALVTDVYIAVSMCLVLQSSRTGFGRTQHVVAKLVTYAIHRGVVLTILQLLQVLTTISTITEIDQIFYFPMSTVYVNSVLAVLNERQHLRAEQNGDLEYVLPSNSLTAGRSTSKQSKHLLSVEAEMAVLDIC